MTVHPTPHDQFTFGLWTVGWQARDPFGDATRPVLDPAESIERLAELGVYGITFHDDDVMGFAASDQDREDAVKRLRSTLDAAGLSAPMVTTNLFTHPVFKEGAFTANDRDVWRFEAFDAEAAGARSHGASVIDQLAVEHLLGAR